MTKSVLLVLDGLIHPTLFGRLALERFLRVLPGYQFQKVRSMEKLPEVAAGQFDGMVLYFHHKTISERALAAFEQYVQQGGGALAIHSASASFKPFPRYFDVLGGRFVKHGPVEPITLCPPTTPPTTGPSFAGIPPFTLRDELYRHQYDPAITVQFEVKTGGEREPFVWSRSFGKGRVLYLAPGHQPGVFRSPQMQEILRRGLSWVCGAEN